MLRDCQTRNIFTFHNVSINTEQGLLVRLPCKVFTFHNVSINTPSKLSLILADTSLHSTMFLLIPVQNVFKAYHVIFTFHNVSINTYSVSYYYHLPSTFTFHNVSINTEEPVRYAPWVLCFTFHNVSINTAMSPFRLSSFVSLHSTMFLLIPFLFCGSFIL